MRSPNPPRPQPKEGALLPAFLLHALLLPALLACGVPAREGAGRALVIGETCDVDVGPGFAGFVATADGGVIARVAPHLREGDGTDVSDIGDVSDGSGGSGVVRPSVIVQRLRGDGCALEAVGAPIAAEQLLDADDTGAVYVFPAEATFPGVVSTMLAGEYAQGFVAKVDVDGTVHNLLPAGRGIWSFGVAPAGDALWVTACGPTGIFAVEHDTVGYGDGDGVEVTQTMTPPATLWQQYPSVLTSAHTFWSVGARTFDETTACGFGAPLSDACGLALVRSTPKGDVEVGPSVVDVGSGFAQGTPSRCGTDVCLVLPTAIVMYDDDDAPARRASVIALDALGARRGEAIAAATGNARGLYVTLTSVDGADARVVFAPFSVSE